MERDRPDPPTASYHSSSPDPEAGSTESGRRARASSLVGAVLIERFELLSLLGIGAFGEVYRARDRKSPSTPVAVKILRRPSAQALYRFKREFRTLGEWSHANLVALHELFLDDDLAFFSMELVAGEDFFSYVRPNGILDDARLRAAARGLCDGVSALHERGRLHRDLKPANVLVEASGRVVIVDLGLATLFGRNAAAGSEVGFIGTVQYAAPEQLAGGAVGPETDWYAVGIMLYEALSGALPYDAPFSEQLQHKSRPPAPIGLAGDALDPLRRVCSELLMPDKKLRAGGDQLHAALSGSRVSTSHEGVKLGPSEPPFLGRRAELETLSEIFRSVESGAARVALVSAPSGLGKTALVERFLRDLASEHRATVLRGRCYVNEEVTYQAVDGNIDALSHHLSNLPRVQVAALLPRDVRSLSRLFPVLNRVEAIASAPPVRTQDDKASLRERAALALRELAARLSDRLPLVLFIDDIQWDDADSAWLLSRVFAEPDPPAVMLIATCRSEGRAESHLLRAFERDAASARRLSEIKLSPLSSEEAAQLAAHANAAVSARPALAERIAAESGGHPMFALELARFAQGHVDDSGEIALVSLDVALNERAQKLSPSARRLLEIVCVAGRPLKYTVALAAAECEIDAVREVVSSKLVTISGTARYDTLSVYHDRIRDSELSALPAERVRALHGVLADALAADEHRFDLIVEHYLAAGRRDAASKYALRAADHAASVLAFHRLPSLLTLASEDSAQKELAALHLRLAESYALLGRGGAAAEAYQKAAEFEPDPDQRWELLSLAMWQAFHAQQLERGFQLLGQLDRALGSERLRPTVARVVESVLRALGWRLFGPPKRNSQPPAQADANEEKRMRLAFRAYTSLLATRGEYSVFFAIEAFRLAAKRGDAPIYAASLAGYAASLSLRSGRPSVRGERMLEEAQRLAEAQSDLGVLRLVQACHASYMHFTGKPLEGQLSQLLDGEYPATPFGTFLRSLFAYTMGGSALFWSGRIAQARTLGASAIARARELAEPQVEAGLRAIMAYRLLADDDCEGAWAEWVSTYERYPEHAALRPPTFGMVIALYQGRLDRAALVMRRAFRLFWRWEAHSVPGRNVVLFWWGALAALRLARGERGLALRFRLWLACALISLRPPPLVAPLSTLLRATQALVTGRRKRGVALLAQAKRRFEERGKRMFGACTSFVLARLTSDAQLAAGYRAEAQAVFEEERIRCPEKWVAALLPALLELSADRAPDDLPAPAR